MEDKPAANKGFAIAGVPCFADTFVQGGSSVLRMKFSAKTPRHRKPSKRIRRDFTRHHLHDWAKNLNGKTRKENNQLVSATHGFKSLAIEKGAAIYKTG